MSKHQIIYTSCKRGINGVTDGLQVYSYDNSYKSISTNEIEELFNYVPPLGSGESLSDEVIASFPVAFSYRRIKGLKVFSSNTYIGHDYMGTSGRYGNFLSHVIILSPEEEIGSYPINYFKSPMFRESISKEEVNNSQKPDFLGEPKLELGSRLNPVLVSSFVNERNRIEVLKKMAACLLHDNERIVLCDTWDNIPCWFAALEYLLPIKSALDISFSVYESRPSLSKVRLCGASRASIDRVRNYYFFDLFDNNIYPIDCDKALSDYIDFIYADEGRVLSDFHSFINDGFDYSIIDFDILNAFYLFNFLHGKALNSKEISLALTFAKKYATMEKLKKISAQLSIIISRIQDTESLLYVLDFFFTVGRHVNLSESITADLFSKCFFSYEIRKETFDSIKASMEVLFQQWLVSHINDYKFIPVNKIDSWKRQFLIEESASLLKRNILTEDTINEDSGLMALYFDLIDNSEECDVVLHEILSSFYENFSLLFKVFAVLESNFSYKDCWDGIENSFIASLNVLAFSDLCVFLMEDQRYLLLHKICLKALVLPGKKITAIDCYSSMIKKFPQIDSSRFASEAYEIIKDFHDLSVTKALYSFITDNYIDSEITSKLADEVAASLSISDIDDILVSNLFDSSVDPSKHLQIMEVAVLLNTQGLDGLCGINIRNILDLTKYSKEECISYFYHFLPSLIKKKVLVDNLFHIISLFAVTAEVEEEYYRLCLNCFIEKNDIDGISSFIIEALKLDSSIAIDQISIILNDDTLSLSVDNVLANRNDLVPSILEKWKKIKPVIKRHFIKSFFYKKSK